jgi:hypothetical protein
MRSYVTVVDGDMDLLPFFATYYTQCLGVTEFYLLTFGTTEHRDKATNILGQHAKVIKGAVFPANKFLVGARDNHIRREVHIEGQWAFFTDMDEFPQFGKQTSKVIAEAEAHNEHYVSGVWLDRVAENGKLKKVEQNRKLVEQFSLSTRTRQHLRMHGNAYILSKVAPINHHPSVCKWAHPYPPHKRYRIHHFKWTDTVKRRLKDRYKRVSLAGRNTGWKKSILRTIKMLNKHKGVPKNILRKVSNDIDI